MPLPTLIPGDYRWDLLGNSDSNSNGSRCDVKSVTPENRKRKQRQLEGDSDVGESEFSFQHLRRKHSNSSARSQSEGSRTLEFLSRYDFDRDDASCSSDSGSLRRYRVRNASRICRIWAALKSRRFRPSLFTECGVAGWPSAMT